MDETRNYGRDEPKVGDVVKLFDGAYCDAVVTRIDGNDAIVERVHASCSLLGQIQLGIERVSLSLDQLRDLRVYVRGPSGTIDNRRDH